MTRETALSLLIALTAASQVSTAHAADANPGEAGETGVIVNAGSGLQELWPEASVADGGQGVGLCQITSTTEGSAAAYGRFEADWIKARGQ